MTVEGIGSDLAALLEKLGLQHYASTFEEEAITDVDLLRSMGKEMLCESLVEIGLGERDVKKLAAAIFGGACDAGDAEEEEEEEEEDWLSLEDNEGVDDGGLATLLAKLGLQQYASTFEEEAVMDVEMLRSMGEEMMCESLGEIGLSERDVNKLAAAIFGGAEDAGDADEAEDGLALEEQPVEPPPPPPPPPPAPRSLPSPAAAAAAAGPSANATRAAEKVKTQGNEALKAGKYAEALELYSQAISLDPTNAVPMAGTLTEYFGLICNLPNMRPSYCASYQACHLQSGSSFSPTNTAPS